MRELAVRHRELVTLVSMDDKHKIKVGEPSYPLAAAERGKQVIVGMNQVMAVGDQDFSKCTLVPSVNLIVCIFPQYLFKSCCLEPLNHKPPKYMITKPKSYFIHM